MDHCKALQVMLNIMMQQQMLPTTILPCHARFARVRFASLLCMWWGPVRSLCEYRHLYLPETMSGTRGRLGQAEGLEVWWGEVVS